MASLAELLQRAGVRADVVHGNAEVSAIVSDSRKVVPGALFVCMPSAHSDSHAFIENAALAGAKSVIVHSSEGLRLAVRAKIAAVLITHEVSTDEGVGCVVPTAPKQYRFNTELCKL